MGIGRYEAAGNQYSVNLQRKENDWPQNLHASGCRLGLLSALVAHPCPGLGHVCGGEYQSHVFL